MPAPLHGKGWLQEAVLDVVEKISTGEIELPENRKATPHIVSKIVQEQRGDENPPSTGAVKAVFDRWVTYGFILTHDQPFAFKDFSAQGRKLGLAGCIEKHKEKLKAERAANKPAKPASGSTKKASSAKGKGKGSKANAA